MVLDIYVKRFFIMLNAAKRLDAKEKIDLITISTIPHLKTENRNSIIESFRQIYDEDDIKDQKAIEKDRVMLRKKLRNKVL